MLHNWKLSQDLCIIHLQHSLIDLAPAVLDARDIVKIRRMLKEGALLDIKYEANSCKVEILRPLLVHGG